MSPEDLLASFRINDTNMKRVYQLGCIAQRLTVYSQQQRALNLVWALNASGELATVPSVAVIGAGFAGLMSAAALKSLGMEVQLYEKMTNILHLQRGNLTRFIQPHIYDWHNKSEHPRFPLAIFPLFRWFQGSAKNVVEQVEKEWSRIQIDTKFGKDLATVEQRDKRYVAKFKDNSEIEADIIILAVGYGIERTVPGHTRLSYWRNDALSQPVVGYGETAEFLVSGTGDGGLIDTLRIRFADFDHQKFVSELLDQNEFLACANAAEKVFARRQDIGAAAEIPFGTKLLDWAKHRLRPDTKVVLNYSTSLFEQSSSLLHRMVLALLIQLEAVEPLEGRVTRCFTGEDGEYAIIEQPRSSHLTARKVANVIIRHGAEPELKRILGVDVWHDLIEKTFEDSTFQRHHEDDFLLDESMQYRTEISYTVHFWRYDNDLDEQINRVILQLAAQLSIARAQADTLISRIQTDAIWKWGNKTAQVRIEIPGAGRRDLIFQTASRSLLERALSSFTQPYQIIEFTVQCDEAEPNWPPIKLDGSMIQFEQVAVKGDHARRIFRIQSTMPRNADCTMLQAHRLLTPSIILGVLRHQWTQQLMIDLGWRLTAPASQDHNWK